MYNITDASSDAVKKTVAFLAALITVLFCTLPMGNLPLWNGEIPEHRNQYELITEAFLDGRIDFAYGDEAELEALKNPYDPVERSETGVTYHWDHAYYDGHYYMYFGVVPVFLAFLPYRLITGTILTTFRATQLFTAVFIAGIFSLFWLLLKLFFKNMKFGTYLSLSVAFSVMSVWYAMAEPALYCTAITAAMALEIWSIYFYVRAVYFEKAENKQILLAAIGALFGALVFGCRPPIALANVIVIPLLIVFIKEHSLSGKLVVKLALAATPYLLVAAGLMTYNYVRFDSPFEFGQAYQLTVTDQTNYSLSVTKSQLIRIAFETVNNFFDYGGISETFPYLKTSSVFVNFPILLFSVVALFPPVWKRIKKTKTFPFMLGLVISVLVITAIDILWSPRLLERYRMDIYFLMGIFCFLALGMWQEENKRKKWLSVLINVLCIVTVITAFLLYVRVVADKYPEIAVEYANILGVP